MDRENYHRKELQIADKGMDLPEAVISSIEKAFPGAEITEVEKEKWKGKVVTEVELTTKDGIHYKVYCERRQNSENRGRG